MENKFLSIRFNTKGAELSGIKDKQTGFEYLWQADKNIWGRHAPILFPIVGKVKDNLLVVNKKTYPMTQHGFARDAEFTVASETNSETWFSLKNNPETSAVFPFQFELLLGYTLEENTLHCHYKVRNTDTQKIFFSIGAHPGFNLPTQRLTDYEIVFDQPENEERYLLNEGLFDGRRKPVLSSANSIQLSSELFDDDAIVFKKLNSEKLVLKQLNGSFAIELEYKNFPYLGIWTQKNCEQYICIEPWCGHSDTVSGHNDISSKEGIISLEIGSVFERSYSLTFIS
jgi:galactose mutarotase-like enzyme